MFGRTAGTERAERLHPPLQAHFSRHRLGDHVTHPRNLVIEGIERPQMRSLVLGRKQAGKVAVLVVAAHDVMAIGSSACLNAHTAISAAAGGRSSARRML